MKIQNLLSIFFVALATSFSPIIHAEEKSPQFSKGWEDMEEILMKKEFSPYTAKSIGDPNAPITIYDISSFSCNHCAHFHLNLLPELKEKYIDEGLVRFVFMHVSFAGDQLTPYISLSTYAAENQDQYLAYTDLIYEKQSEWYSENYQNILDQMMKTAFIPKEKLDILLQDEKAITNLQRTASYAFDVLNVTGTPTFILAQTGDSPEQEISRLSGADLKKLTKAIDKALKSVK